MYIIDVQGFKYRKEEFVCKEIAILDSNNHQIWHEILKLPISSNCLKPEYRNQNTWVTANIHGLWWDGADSHGTGVQELDRCLSRMVRTGDEILVKGLEKKQWLAKYIPSNPITDMLDLGCPKLTDLKERITYSSGLDNEHCCMHSCKMLCARQNVFLLMNWYNENKRST